MNIEEEDLRIEVVSEILVQIKLLEVEVKGGTLKEMVMTIGLRTVTEVVEIDPSDLNRICQEEEEVEVALIKVQV